MRQGSRNAFAYERRVGTTSPNRAGLSASTGVFDLYTRRLRVSSTSMTLSIHWCAPARLRSSRRVRDGMGALCGNYGGAGADLRLHRLPSRSRGVRHMVISCRHIRRTLSASCTWSSRRRPSSCGSSSTRDPATSRSAESFSHTNGESWSRAPHTNSACPLPGGLR